MLTTPSFSSLGCLPLFTVAEIQLPPSHSVYIALLLCLLCAPAPWRITLPTAVPLWSEPVLQPHRAATQLSDSPPRSLPLLCWHACHCCRKALLSFKAWVASRSRVSQGNGWRLSSNHNANLKSSAFDQLFVYGTQLYGGSNHIQMIWNKLAQRVFCSISLSKKGFFPPQFSNIFLLVFPALSWYILVGTMMLPLKPFPWLACQVKRKTIVYLGSSYSVTPLWIIFTFHKFFFFLLVCTAGAESGDRKLWIEATKHLQAPIGAPWSLVAAGTGDSPFITTQ